jgi:hypothetical protein
MSIGTKCEASGEGDTRMHSNDAEIVKIFDRTAIERLLEPTNYLGNSGIMVDHVLAGKQTEPC